jgi:flagellar protein FliJ
MNPATLTLLIERARSRSEAAQLRFANLQRLVGQARAHLAMLRQYAQEYNERARCRPGDDRDPSAERNQMAFLERLEQAVAAQVRELALRENAANAGAGELALCQRKHKSLQTLALRRVDQERRVEARRDQKNTDEFAQRAHERAAATGLLHVESNAGSK